MKIQNWKNRLYANYVSIGQASELAKDEIPRYPYYEKLIESHFPKNKQINIIDLACGDGVLVHHLREKGYYNSKGIDISKEQIDKAHRLGVQSVHQEDIFDFIKRTPKESYDIVVLMDILEHLEPEEVLKISDGLYNILRPKGKAFFHTPNASGIFGMSIRYGDFTHSNAFTAKSIKQVLSTSGFRSSITLEDKPTIYSLRSLLRYAAWEIITTPHRLISYIETGAWRIPLSRNILTIAIK